MEIRRVDHNTYDLFHGKGWNNWTRVRKGRSSTFGLQGQRIPHSEMKALDEVLHPRMPINYGQSLEQTINNLNAMRH